MAPRLTGLASAFSSVSAAWLWCETTQSLVQRTLRRWNASCWALPQAHSASLLVSFRNGSVSVAKFVIKRAQKFTIPRKLHTSTAICCGRAFLTASIFFSSGATPSAEVLNPINPYSGTLKTHFSRFSVSPVLSRRDSVSSKLLS